MNPNMEKLTPHQEDPGFTAVDAAESAFNAAGDHLTETVQGSNKQVADLGGETAEQRDQRKDSSMDLEFQESELYRQRTQQRREKRREKFTTVARTVGRLLTRR
jgi:hypothetical protein